MKKKEPGLKSLLLFIAQDRLYGLAIIGAKHVFIERNQLEKLSSHCQQILLHRAHSLRQLHRPLGSLGQHSLQEVNVPCD
jgi:hypothetical protein